MSNGWVTAYAENLKPGSIVMIVSAKGKQVGFGLLRKVGKSHAYVDVPSGKRLKFTQRTWGGYQRQGGEDTPSLKVSGDLRP
jgi:hypothetical protein